LAVEAGVDAIGLNFWPSSKRVVTVAQAQEICAQLPAFVTVVALFVNAERTEIEQILRQVPVDLLQFHGDEEPAFCRMFSKPYVKALRMRSDIDLEAAAIKYSDASGLLLDAYRKGVPGGTGERFEWQRIPVNMRGQITLAGGLTADNVAEAVAAVAPYAVDVSGGVEQSAGVKHAAKISSFVDAVARADRSASC